MDYKKLTSETWNGLDKTGTIVSGYKGTWLSKIDGEESPLHIFLDETGKYHLAIETDAVSVNDPGVNGLSVSIKSFRIQNSIKKIIDLQCNSDRTIKEFTEIVKEIATDILENDTTAVDVVNRVIRNWKVFWSKQALPILSEEELIGLICELYVLNQLCKINNANAILSWRGPLGEPHDFVFTDWTIEVKGSKGKSITINGIDQLAPVKNKQLGFLSFKISISDSTKDLCLQGIIDEIINKSLHNRPDLIVRFNELLFAAGYSPIYAEEYRKFHVEIVSGFLYVVDDSFPKLTSHQLSQPLDERVTSVRYSISLEGLTGTEFNQITLGDYFY